MKKQQLAGSLLGLVVGLEGCRTPSKPPAATPAVIQGNVDPKTVDAVYQDAWQAFEQARKADLQGAAVIETADRLLALDPPIHLKLAAIYAKANVAYAKRDDEAVMSLSKQGLEALQTDSYSQEQPGQHLELTSPFRRLQALAAARSGQAQWAVEELLGLWEARQMAELEFYAGLAMAYDRLEKTSEATLAYARWRELLPPDSDEAVYAEERMRFFWRGLPREQLVQLAQKASGSQAARCLLYRAGQEISPESPSWVQNCGRSVRTIGILLPRTGALAGLADEQLAAARAAIRVLSRTRKGEAPQIVWADSGSDPQKAVAGAAELRKKHADILVGPLLGAEISAVLNATEGKIGVIVPGEDRAGAIGVAPPLEARIARLLALGKQQKVNSLLVMAPENAYGQRAVKAAQEKAAKSGIKTVKAIFYPPQTTSFATFIRPEIKALGRGTALLIADRMGRVDMILRQLARLGIVPAPASTTATVVLTTGENLSPAVVMRSPSIFEGLWLAPMAGPDAEGQFFATEYEALEGQAPSDQAWLVWRALVAAWDEGLQPAQDQRPVTLYHVEKGQLVEQAP